MIKTASIRERARYSLERNLFSHVWLMLICCIVISGIVEGVPSFIATLLSRVSPVVGALVGVPLYVAAVLIAGPISYGMARIYHKVALGDKDVKVADIFLGFKTNLAESVYLGFMRSLFIFLWSLLFIIPGIIKSYAYSMAFFIQEDSNGSKNWRTCLDESIKLTDGYKGKLFLLDLSFIGWSILGYLCFGVGILWVTAYHQTARAHFYEELKVIKYGFAESTEEDVIFAEGEIVDDGDIYRYGDEEDEEDEKSFHDDDEE